MSTTELLMAATGWTLAKRPHYTPPDRLGEAALVQLAQPVNRFPDYVRELVRSLKHTVPWMGRQRLADTLAREGLVLAASTVRRMAREMPPKIEEPDPSHSDEAGDSHPLANSTPPAPKRKLPEGITARYFGHVWHCDLTVVPTALGFWLPWFPFCVWLGWPFAYWVVGVVDQHTRTPIKLKAFKQQPSSRDVRRFLQSAVKEAGKAPKHLITDRGVQFQADYRAWCKRFDIKPRWGAVASHKSIAIIERFWRSMKGECCGRAFMPLRLPAVQAELDCYAAWFRLHRPHQALQGITPEERRADELPNVVRLEPRPKMPIRGDPISVRRVASVELSVERFAGREHLPVIHLEAA
ncbi:MAG: transposase [Myxococcales bacterium]|nr:transposase [Myxococcales bacterium]MCB9610660.1 transposase [Polyangiaceae bacterium]